MRVRSILFLVVGISVSFISCRNYGNPDDDKNIEKKSLYQEKRTSVVRDNQQTTISGLDSENLITDHFREDYNRNPSTETDKIHNTGYDPSVKLINPLEELYPTRIQSFRKIENDLSPLIVRNPVIESYIWPFKKFIITLDNDLFSNTDRYYTNGVRIIVYSPSLAFWKLNSILPVNLRKSIEYNSIELHHGMYTPYSTKLPPVLKDDRPYASTLFIRYKRRTDTPTKRYSQSASIDIGVIGNVALGSYLQKGVHAGLPSNDEPLGWETQISNDIIVNYNYEYSKQIYESGVVEGYSFGGGSLGSLHTSLESGFRLRISNDQNRLIPFHREMNVSNKLYPAKWHISFDSELAARLIGYNATLSGGLLNKKNHFVLMPEEIERLVILAGAGFTASYGKYGISLSQHYISKEFNKGKCHFWGQIGINIGF